ncbi:MAG: VCBS repeat-containing protein [Bacteroidetes bacterium]|nr:VCBS repeat-containing protein [Bacteroidota bacterium]
MKISRILSISIVLSMLTFGGAFSYIQKNKSSKKTIPAKTYKSQTPTKTSSKPTQNISPEKEAVFELLTEDETNLRFNNIIPPGKDLKPGSKLFNIAAGGVAVGDVNGDGLPDIYLTRFSRPNQLFINKGNFKFEVAPESAGVSDSASCSFGATMVDIDGDGDLDIYVSEYNVTPNRLFINNGDGTFTDKAKEYGLDFAGNCIQATFFDYDNDGDLDMYLVVNGISHLGYKAGGVSSKLYQNNGNNTFTDVAEKAGIVHKGFGLSASIADYNNDGWLDIYTAVDFEEPDHLYFNQHNGTFKDVTKSSTNHTSYFSMGSDAADINNDGFIDFMTLDMLPDNHKRRNTQFETLSTFSTLYDSTQMVKNTLQLNRGDGTFSDIGYLAGVAQTDWSWTTLFADFNNDGYKDIIVTNGLKYDIMDRDAIRHAASPDILRQMGLNDLAELMEDSVKKFNTEDLDLDPYFRKLPRTHVGNFLYRNNGDLSFANVSDQWGFKVPYNTVAAAYADFDNDGDLDLVLNNIDTMATVYRNMSREHSLGNYLQVKLVGKGKNTEGLGTRIEAMYNGKSEIVELGRTRGFASSGDAIAHFGLGTATKVDELTIRWLGGETQTLKNVKANQRIIIKEVNSVKAEMIQSEQKPTIFTVVSPDSSLNFRHYENIYDDFFQDRLLPNRLSINGPGMAVGDVNGDGLEDVYIGGPQGIPGSLFLQQSNGRFVVSPQAIIALDSMCEDQGVLFFDADGDGDLDLYVSSGGNEGSIEEPRLLQDRLYINDGKGKFSKGLLPVMLTSTSTVVAGDFDNDGDLDLFIGGRNVPGKYPDFPQSYILLNEHGTFIDVTDQLCHDIVHLGMITSALWTDYNNDGQVDLIVTGEWMTPHIFQNMGGRFKEVTKGSGLEGAYGWWNSINAGDFDNDGDIDYVMGNLGLNCRYKASEKEPIELYSSDFDDNGSIDHVMTYYTEGKQYPLRVFNAMYNQMPSLNKKFPRYEDFALADFHSMFTKEQIDSAVHLKATDFGNSYIENLGGGKFSIHALPMIAQSAPIFGTSVEDYNSDGNLDILAVGNFYGPDREAWRYDASQGFLMLGDGKGGFEPTYKSESGFYDLKDARSLITVTPANNEGMYIMAGNNDAQLQVFKKRNDSKTSVLKVDSKSGFSYAILTLKNGQFRRHEFYYGAGYLSQSSMNMIISSEVKSISFYKGGVVKKTINLSHQLR